MGEVLVVACKREIVLEAHRGDPDIILRNGTPLQLQAQSYFGVEPGSDLVDQRGLARTDERFNAMDVIVPSARVQSSKKQFADNNRWQEDAF